jgi:hypothetical protein
VSKQAIQKWRQEGMRRQCQLEYGEYDLLCVYNWYKMYKLYDEEKMEEITANIDTICEYAEVVDVDGKTVSFSQVFDYMEEMIW